MQFCNRSIELPLPIKVSTNAIYAGMHWAKRKQIADEYHRALLPFKGIKIHTPVTQLSFAFSFRTRPLDCSNCSFMAKCLEDAMVMNRLIPSDTPDHVKSIAITSTKGAADAVQITW